MAELAEDVLRGDLRALARAATLIEDRDPCVAKLLTELRAKAGRALILGITGAPGAGKSTLCDRMISLLRDEGKTVGVIAVDPSSPVTGGAILGDRIRMQQHHADPGVFIRSMATRGIAGGIARATADLATLLDRDGIAIRAGHHCAQPLHMKLGLGATARASFYIYNEPSDVDALTDGISTAKRIMKR